MKVPNDRVSDAIMIGPGHQLDYFSVRHNVQPSDEKYNRTDCCEIHTRTRHRSYFRVLMFEAT